MVIQVPRTSQQTGGSFEIGGGGAVQPFVDSTGQQIEEVGGELVRAGVGLNRLGNQLADEINNARVKDADSAGYEFARSKQLEFESLVGPDALPTKEAQSPREKSRIEIEKEFDRLAAGLDNDRQRMMFSKSAAHRLRNSSFAMEVHEVKQVRAYNIGRSEARAIQFGEEAISAYNPNDTSPVASQVTHLALQMMKRETREVGRLKGRSEEEIEVQIDKALDLAHAGAINKQLGEQNPEGARKYLNQYGDELSPDMRSDLSKSIKSSEDTQWAKSETENISLNVQDNQKIYRSLAGKLRRGDITPERYAKAATAAKQRQDAAKVEGDAIRSEAIRNIRESGTLSFDQLPAEQQATIRAAGLESSAKNYMDAQANGQPTPALVKGESANVVAQLKNLSPMQIRQVFNQDTTQMRYDQIASVVGVDWVRHQTTVKGMIDEAYGENSGEAQIKASNTEIRQVLGAYPWAHVASADADTSELRMENPLSESVVRGAEAMILERLSQDPSVTIQQVMDELSNGLANSTMFTGTGVIEGSKIPHQLMRFIDPEEAASATTGVGPPIDAAEVTFGQVAKMPTHITSHYRRKMSLEKGMTFDDLAPATQRSWNLRFAQAWVRDGSPTSVKDLETIEARNLLAETSPELSISMSTTPMEIQLQAGQYVKGNKVTIPTVEEIIGQPVIFGFTPMGEIGNAQILIQHLKALKGSLEGGK